MLMWFQKLCVSLPSSHLQKLPVGHHVGVGSGPRVKRLAKCWYPSSITFILVRDGRRAVNCLWEKVLDVLSPFPGPWLS